MRKSKMGVVALTLIIGLIALAAPRVLEDYGAFLAIAMILLLGVPHGATDHILFHHVSKDNRKGWLARFLGLYVVSMGVFALVWWLLPSAALLLFLAISAYHFGQSQWHDLKLSSLSSVFIYSTWGAFVLAAPLLWNHPETGVVVNELVGNNVFTRIPSPELIPLLVLTIVVVQLVVLYLRKSVPGKRLLWELSVLVLLAFLFYNTSLLLGFAVYFVFWHSLDSIQEQLVRLRRADEGYTLKNYISQLIPFTLLAFLGIGIFTWLSPAAPLSAAWLGQFFMLISIVTLPHSLLMDVFLEDKSLNAKARAHSQKHYKKIVFDQ